MANIARMTKKQLVAHGKKVGANLNMDQTRKEMIAIIKGKPTIKVKQKDLKVSTKAKPNQGGLELFDTVGPIEKLFNSIKQIFNRK
jgi:hypothetical protein